MVADQTIRDADANAQGSTTMADLMAGLPPLLLGTYTPKIDAKGRMALPAKFRSQLGQGLVMARGQERCVYLLPFDEFRRIASQIQRVSVGNKAAREYLRVFRCRRPAAGQAGPRAGAADAARLRQSGFRRRGDRRWHPCRTVE